MRKIKSLTLVVVGTALPVMAYAQLSAPSVETGSGEPLESIIARVINIFLGIVAIVAVIFIIIGGIQYITSAGDEKRSDTAKNTILYAIIGLIVVGLASAIARFALRAFGVTG